MYSKYEEMYVIRDILNKYNNSQKQGYEGYVQQLKGVALDVENIDGQKNLLSVVNQMQYYSTTYNKGKEVAKELQKAINCYERDYTQDNIQSGLADKKGKEGNRIFFELRTKNDGYKEIMSEMAMDLWRTDDYHMSGLGLDFDSHLARLEQSFTSGNITKEQLIYYANMSNALLNTPQYVEYMQQFSHGGAQR